MSGSVEESSYFAGKCYVSLWVDQFLSVSVILFLEPLLAPWHPAVIFYIVFTITLGVVYT